MKLTLDNLRATYLAERNLTDYFATANPPKPVGTPAHCRYCGKHWRHWNGSKLDGHARCVVGDEFKLALLALTRAEPTLTLDRLRIALDVSIAVVRSWISDALELKSTTRNTTATATT